MQLQCRLFKSLLLQGFFKVNLSNVEDLISRSGAVTKNCSFFFIARCYVDCFVDLEVTEATAELGIFSSTPVMAILCLAQLL